MALLETESRLSGSDACGTHRAENATMRPGFALQWRDQDEIVNED
jgi:hypothetical protein